MSIDSPIPPDDDQQPADLSLTDLEPGDYIIRSAAPLPASLRRVHRISSVTDQGIFLEGSGPDVAYPPEGWTWASEPQIDAAIAAGEVTG